jgi:heme-degrading monooxygenase HmoA
MTLIKINAITVPEDAGDELARRFAARAGAVDGQDGFEGFELLRPTDVTSGWSSPGRGTTRRSKVG